VLIMNFWQWLEKHPMQGWALVASILLTLYSIAEVLA
jgi:hypothetical protein